MIPKRIERRKNLPPFGKLDVEALIENDEAVVVIITTTVDEGSEVEIEGPGNVVLAELIAGAAWAVAQY